MSDERTLYLQTLFDTINVLLKNIEKEKPNFHSVWIKFIEKKTEKIITDLQGIRDGLEKVNMYHQDIHKDTLDFLMMLYLSSQ